VSNRSEAIPYIGDSRRLGPRTTACRRRSCRRRCGQPVCPHRARRSRQSPTWASDERLRISLIASGTVATISDEAQPFCRILSARRNPLPTGRQRINVREARLGHRPSRATNRWPGSEPAGKTNSPGRLALLKRSPAEFGVPIFTICSRSQSHFLCAAHSITSSARAKQRRRHFEAERPGGREIANGSDRPAAGPDPRPIAADRAKSPSATCRGVVGHRPQTCVHHMALPDDFRSNALPTMMTWIAMPSLSWHQQRS
jgi:hypothetical protein